jgi:hypothetical protein
MAEGTGAGGTGGGRAAAAGAGAAGARACPRQFGHRTARPASAGATRSIVGQLGHLKTIIVVFTSESFLNVRASAPIDEADTNERESPSAPPRQPRMR